VVVRVVTRQQVLERVRSGMTYEQAAAELGLRPGAAYLIATGLPADGSAALGEDDLARPGAVTGSTQHLSNPEQVSPTFKSEVQQWMAARAARGKPGHDPGSTPGSAPGSPDAQGQAVPEPVAG
jgi:hypothetical protein